MIKYRPADDLVVVATHGRGLFTSDVFMTNVEADFKTNTRVAYIGQPVKFTDLSFGTSNTFFWDFGDGKTSALRNPTNNYEQPGSYSVSLTISNGTVEEIKTNYIHVLPDRMVSYLLSNGGNFEVFSNDFVALNIQGTGFARLLTAKHRLALAIGFSLEICLYKWVLKKFLLRLRCHRKELKMTW